MSINSPIVFIGIPLSNPALDNTFQSFLQTKMPPVGIESITALDGKNVPQWNFAKAYFVDVKHDSPEFTLLVNEFGDNNGGELDAVLLGYNTKKHYLDMFKLLLDQVQ
ncbi:MAG: hypothetical protein Q8T08_21875 [Ignavibacteria bacterium]|nr:hypothetical protein [Ignavibacteria bacterium]